MTGNCKALVVGANGGIGSEMGKQLVAVGWQVVAFARTPPPSDSGDGFEWVRGDAMQAEDVQRAARGCEVIVHAVNPPGYRRWSELVLPMLESTLSAAEQERALVVLPGTLYNYGPDAFPLLREDSLQQPDTPKGAIRVEMERRLRAYSERGGSALIVRAGDFFGPNAGSTWFSQSLVTPGRPVKVIHNPGTPGVGHQWSYLPDVARTMVALIERRESLAAFAVYQMGAHWDHDGTQMAQAICRVVARSEGRTPKVRAFPWWLLRLAAPAVPLFREILEMRYLWQQPIRMDNSKLVAELGREPETPLDAAVEASLFGLNCIGKVAAGRGTVSLQ